MDSPRVNPIKTSTPHAIQRNRPVPNVSVTTDFSAVLERMPRERASAAVSSDAPCSPRAMEIVTLVEDVGAAAEHLKKSVQTGT